MREIEEITVIYSDKDWGGAITLECERNSEFGVKSVSKSAARGCKRSVICAVRFTQGTRLIHTVEFKDRRPNIRLSNVWFSSADFCPHSKSLPETVKNNILQICTSCTYIYHFAFKSGRIICTANCINPTYICAHKCSSLWLNAEDLFHHSFFGRSHKVLASLPSIHTTLFQRFGGSSRCRLADSQQAVLWRWRRNSSFMTTPPCSPFLLRNQSIEHSGVFAERPGF